MTNPVGKLISAFTAALAHEEGDPGVTLACLISLPTAAAVFAHDGMFDMRPGAAVERRAGP